VILSSVLRLCSKPRSGWHGYANAPCRPLDARDSCLPRFLMRRLLPEGSFLFTSSRFGLLRSGVSTRCFPCGLHLVPWFPSVLRLCSTWRGSWEYWLSDSNRVDLSPPASLHVRDPFLRLTTLFQTSVGLARIRERTVPSLRRSSQLPDSLPVVSSAARRQFPIHQFPVRIAPYQRP